MGPAGTTVELFWDSLLCVSCYTIVCISTSDTDSIMHALIVNPSPTRTQEGYELLSGESYKKKFILMWINFVWLGMVSDN